MMSSRMALLVSQSGKSFANPIVASPFTATLVTPTLSWTTGQSVSAMTPVVFSGGVPPYNVTVSPLIPGLTVRSSDGQINAGTAGSVTATANYRFTGQDQVGTVQFQDVSITITSAVSALRLLVPYSVDANGTSQAWVIGNADVNGGDGVVRWGSRSDPGGTATSVFINRLRSGDPQMSGSVQRSEAVQRYNPSNSSNATPSSNSFLWVDQSNWVAFAHWIPSNSGSSGWPSVASPTVGGDDRQTFFQVHSNDGNSPPFSMELKGDGLMRYYTVAHTTNGSAGADVLISTPFEPQRDIWMKHIMHYTRSETSPLIEIWRAYGNGSYTKVFTYTTLFGNAQAPDTDDYPKGPLYKYGALTYGTRTDRYCYFYGLGKDVGANLLSQAQTFLSSI